jgi:ABC-type phosphate/phosphonate transport system substrate-binding protein
MIFNYHRILHDGKMNRSKEASGIVRLIFCMKRYCFVLGPCGLAALIFSFLLFTTCKPKSPAYEPTYAIDSAEKKTLLYGVPTQAFYEIHAAFVAYLNDHLPDLHIRIVANSNFLAYIDNVNTRAFDIALANGILALDSARLGYSILGTSVEETANAGVILVNKDSSINNFSDLKGKTVATVGSPTLGGHMLPMLYLFKNGLNVNTEIKLKYLESFESVILNIYLGKCSAGFANLNGWSNFLKKKPEAAIRVADKWETPAVVGNPLLIRNDIGKETISRLRSVILTMHLNEKGKKALADIGYLKFIPTDSNTYRPLRNILKEYRALIIDPKR